MALPTNKIKKIKLTSNTEYDIVPSILQDGSTTNKLSVPTLSADNDEVVTTKIEQDISGIKTFNNGLISDKEIKINYISDISPVVSISPSVTGSGAKRSRKLNINMYNVGDESYDTVMTLSSTLGETGGYTISLDGRTTVNDDLIVSGNFNLDSASIINPNDNSKGLILPDTTSYLANKTIATTDQIPSTYVISVNGDSGAITNVAKTNANNTFTGSNTFYGTGTATLIPDTLGPLVSYDKQSTIVGGQTVTLNTSTRYGVTKIIKNPGGVNEYSYSFPSKSGTFAMTSDIPSLTNYVTTNTAQTISGAKTFTGTVGNTQSVAGVYLGLDENAPSGTPAPNANMAIVSANTAAYIDMGRPDVDYDFRIIKWNDTDNKYAQLVYAGNATSSTITIPMKTGTMALTSDIPSLTNYVTTNTEQRITARKKFQASPEISAIYDATKDANIITFGYSSSEGSYLATAGNIRVYGDDDSGDDVKPEAKISYSDDLNAVYYNTGISTIVDGGDSVYKMSFPEKSGTLVVNEEKSYTMSNVSSLNGNYEYYFGEIVPDRDNAQWEAEYIIEVAFPSQVKYNSTGYELATTLHVIATSTSTLINTATTNSVQSPNVTSWLSISPAITSSSSSWGTIYAFSRYSFRMLPCNVYQQSITSGHGHLFGLYNTTSSTFTSSTAIKFNVKVIRTTGCKINLFDNYSYQYYSSDLTLNGITYKAQYVYGSSDNPGLYSPSIESARSSVYTGNTWGNSSFYLTGATGTGTGSLYRNSNLYYNTYDYTLYSTYNGFHTGTTQYKSNQVVYNGYTITWPSKSGTIALTSDITSIAIEDLTDE